MLAPLRGFWDTQSEVDRMFDHVVRDLLGRRPTDTASRTWSPQLEAYAKGGDLMIHYPLPGVGMLSGKGRIWRQRVNTAGPPGRSSWPRPFDLGFTTRERRSWREQ